MHFLQNKIREIIEDSSLKIATISLSVISLIFAILLALDFSKEAILIERACETTLVKANSNNQTQAEIESFIKTALSLRFDSIIERDPASFLANDLLAARTKEQNELNRGGVDQRLIIRVIKAKDNKFIIEADRLIAIQKARSAISTILVVQIASKPRSITNPYGLILTVVEQIKEVKND
ncbi:MAG: hypothetical protein M9962_11110 [Oligoflexia bacterium]|nr:hypothetical protein [Oligoflexia bacterium]